MKRCVLWLLAAGLALGGCSGIANVDGRRYTEPGADRITFWGHACMYIDAGGVGVVTDPVFDKNLWQRRRFIGAPPASLLQHARVVVLSHAHDDHTSPASLRQFPAQTVILAPTPVAAFLAGKGIAATAMAPGEERVVDGIRFIAVAAHHAGKRRGTTAHADGRALGWVIVTPTATLYYSGDTDYCSTFSQVGRTWAPEIAILNVNGHLMPDAAARAARELRAPVVVPIHWGAYGYWIVGGNRRPRGEERLKELVGERLRVLEVGQSLPLEGPRREE